MYLEVPLLAVILCVANAVQCQWGKFGDSCERNCSCHCALVNNNTAKHCRKSDGECSVGCIPGWYGITCSVNCSENCLNKICTQGCIENYKGPLCNIRKDFSNPNTCKSDSAQPHLTVVLGSLLGVSVLVNIICVGNVLSVDGVWCDRGALKKRGTKIKNQEIGILSNVLCYKMCPEIDVCCILTVAVYIASILASPNCKNCLFGKCDEDGICTDGCEPGYADIDCQHPCQETCLKGTCIVDNHTGTTMCTEGCVDGFCYPACRIPCPEGCLRCKRMLCENCTLCESHLYGQSCQYSCVEKCNGYACGIQGNCSQDKCMDGRYGKSCSKSCKPRYESCDQESGQCIKCRRGLFGDDCQNHCSHECLSMEEDEMFRCSSGCTLCELPPHTDAKQDMDFSEIKSQFNIMYGLIVAVMVLALGHLCLYIINTWPLECGRSSNAENTSVTRGASSEQSLRVPEEPGSAVGNRVHWASSSDSLSRSRSLNRSTISKRGRSRSSSRASSSDSLTRHAAGAEGVPLLETHDTDDEEESQKSNTEADSQQPSQQMQGADNSFH
ncbi:cell death abnormality protein 1-like [Haliotis rubra]|uniref:cell death abnormality protein 1-like n=1 Tax=Haliotis rubra TaxID=36100 RepID=UPI001EE553DD|nr:cell death abnormality protein 1-like [Haliotis rubra]